MSNSLRKNCVSPDFGLTTKTEKQRQKYDMSVCSSERHAYMGRNEFRVSEQVYIVCPDYVHNVALPENVFGLQFT